MDEHCSPQTLSRESCFDLRTGLRVFADHPNANFQVDKGLNPNEILHGSLHGALERRTLPRPPCGDDQRFAVGLQHLIVFAPKRRRLGIGVKDEAAAGGVYEHY